MGGMVGKHHSVSAVFILLLNGQKYKQKKKIFWIVIKIPLESSVLD